MSVGNKHPRSIDLTGASIGLLSYVSEAGYVKQKRRIIVKCACGNTKELWATNFISGKTKSCGCMKDSASSKRCHILATTLERDWHGRCIK